MKTRVFSLMLMAVCTMAALAVQAAEDVVAQPEGLKPIGEAKGIHPGRVVWVHNPEVLDWKGPGDGHWWEPAHTRQEQADVMMARAVCDLTGERTVAKAWDKLFRHLNKTRGKGNVGYRAGEKVAIKPNWVGFIWRGGAVDAETYFLTKQQDYMNTSPQMIVALLRQLVAVGVKERDITVCDTLADLPNEYYNILHDAFPNVQYADHAGKSGRVKVTPSSVPLYWSSRPEGKSADSVPTCFAEAEYLVNFANLKAHTGAGVTLCAKNHFGSLVRAPVEGNYFDLHPGSFSTRTNAYREQVDLLGHAHLGGKTVLYLIDALFCGKHPVDQSPRKMTSPPFNDDWPKSLFASQDPVAIDSVGFDFLWLEYTDFPRRPGVDDYLHEAALANHPPSGTFYDPNHATPVKRLDSLGVHEHWNNPQDKKYSRNLGLGKGIELLQVELTSKTAARK